MTAARAPAISTRLDDEAISKTQKNREACDG
jgi:hypothetical protein